MQTFKIISRNGTFHYGYISYNTFFDMVHVRATLNNRELDLRFKNNGNLFFNNAETDLLVVYDMNEFEKQIQSLKQKETNKRHVMLDIFLDRFSDEPAAKRIILGGLENAGVNDRLLLAEGENGVVHKIAEFDVQTGFWWITKTALPAIEKYSIVNELGRDISEFPIREFYVC